MTNLGDRYLDQSTFAESSEGIWIHATRGADGAHVVALALGESTAAKAGEAAEAARAVASQGDPHVAQLVEASTSPAALIWGPVGPKRLADLVKQRGGLPLDRVIDVAHQIAQALVAAEAAGVPHFDLNPRTVGVLDGGDAGMLVRVAGIGASKLLPLYSTTKKNDPFHGSPEYMAPEVCGGKGADHRSDIYALGIIMYEMVTVKPPFLSNNINTTIKRQIYEKPLPLHLVKPGVEHISDFEKVVLRAVEKDPKKRFQTAADLLAALETLRDDLFPTLVFSDPSQVQVRAQERAAAPEEDQGAFIPAAAEDITSRKHGTLVFSGLGQALDLDEEEDRSAAAAAGGQAAPGKPGTQIFAGLGDLIDEEDEDDDDDVRAHPTLVGAPVVTEAESFAVDSTPAAQAAAPRAEVERTTITVPPMQDDEPEAVERTVILHEQEVPRRPTVMFDPSAGLEPQSDAATLASPEIEEAEDVDEASEAEDDLGAAAPVAEAPAPKQTMLFEAVKADSAAKLDLPSTTGAPAEPAADRPEGDEKHAEMVSWAATQPPRERAKSEEMEAWFVDASLDAGEPLDPYSLAEGKKSTRKFMIVMGVVTVVLVVFVAMFLDTDSDKQKPPKTPARSANIEQSGTAKPKVDPPAEPPAAPEPSATQLQATRMVELGDQALGRQDVLGAKVLYEQALKLDTESDGAKAGLEKVAALEAQQAAAQADAGAAASPDAGGGSEGGAVAGAEGAAAVEAAAAAKAAEEAAAAKAAEEAAAAKAAEEAAAAKAAEEAAAAKAAEEAAAKKAAEEAAAAKGTDSAAAAKAAEAAAAKKAAAAKAAEEAAAKKAADEAASAKAAEAAAAKKAADEAAAKKAAEAAAAKKAAEGTTEKKVVDEAAAKKAAEAAAAKKAAAAEAKKVAAEAAAAKKAEAAAAKKAAEAAAAKKAADEGNKGAAASPEDESKKLVKLGIGAMKSGNNPLALKYFNKAKSLNPDDKYIQKYIEKASQ